LRPFHCLRDTIERNAVRLARDEISRVTQRMAMSKMAASIVREINQPLAAAPDLGEVRAALQHIVNDTQRANEVIEKVWLTAKITL
jgi:C4-dicarboxylate-specific signal transduction histidine kinase